MSLPVAKLGEGFVCASPERPSEDHGEIGRAEGLAYVRKMAAQLRHADMPDPQPISCGSISQGMPLFSTNITPVSAARSSIGGRPPFGRGAPAAKGRSPPRMRRLREGLPYPPYGHDSPRPHGFVRRS